MTFAELIAEFPPPPDIPIENIMASLQGIDKNDDDMWCAKSLPGDEINAIDNAANVP